MTIVLRIAGLLWVFLGIGNIIGAPWKVLAHAGTINGLAFDLLVFVLPGLVIFSIGDAMENRRTKAAYQNRLVQPETPRKGMP